MPITLQQAKVNLSNPIDQNVIELFQRKSDILNKMVFDNTISPQGGSTLAYTYQQELTPSVAAGRAMKYDKDDHRFTWPMPKTEMDSNPQLKGQQNPGY
mgnify:CR=1 FL=1